MRKLYRTIRTIALAATLFAVAFTAAIQLQPVRCLRAIPKGDATGVRVVIILGFGYELSEDGKLKPGPANEFLLQWALKNYPDVKTILVQEGVRAAVCEAGTDDCEIAGVRLVRIHLHNPAIDVNTFETAVCAIRRMQELNEAKAILIAHHLQLWRAARSFERVRQQLCQDCEFVVPDVPATPYPAESAQWRTRSEFVYRFVEEFARVRDSQLLNPEVRGDCVAPSAER